MRWLKAAVLHPRRNAYNRCRPVSACIAPSASLGALARNPLTPQDPSRLRACCERMRVRCRPSRSARPPAAVRKRLVRSAAIGSARYRCDAVGRLARSFGLPSSPWARNTVHLSLLLPASKKITFGVEKTTLYGALWYAAPILMCAASQTFEKGDVLGDSTRFHTAGVPPCPFKSERRVRHRVANRALHAQGGCFGQGAAECPTRGRHTRRSCTHARCGSLPRRTAKRPCKAGIETQK